MLYGVIDVGSNSVRLLVSDGTHFGEKFVLTTRLSEGLAFSGRLLDRAIKRTADAVAFFKEKAESFLVDKLFVFATAAVRQAENGSDFCREVFRLTGLTVDVLSGEQEALSGLYGVLKEGDGAILDIGGASTELTVRKDGKTVYAVSVPVGVVRLTDTCGQDVEKLSSTCDAYLSELKPVFLETVYAIGGTATSLAGVLLKLDPYDRKKTHGKVLKKEDVFNLIQKFSALTIEERKNIKGLKPERADVILAGTVLLYRFMDKMGLKSVIVSENDNLEGYLYQRIVL